MSLDDCQDLITPEGELVLPEGEKIGQTPMVVLDGERHIWAKQEAFNFTGSVKVRPMQRILVEAIQRGEVIPGVTHLVEATSGNMGIALAALGRVIGCPVTIIMPSCVSEQRREMIRGYGANLELVDSFEEAIKRRDSMASNKNTYSTDQFLNNQNWVSHYHELGREIIEEAIERGQVIEAVIVGTGTGGTGFGIGNAVKNRFPNARIFMLEPEESPHFSQGITSKHGIQGIQDGTVECILSAASDRAMFDDHILVSTEDAEREAIRLMNEAGFYNGISSGALSLGARKVHDRIKGEMAENGIIVTILPDSADRHDFGVENLYMQMSYTQAKAAFATRINPEEIGAHYT